MYRIEVISAKKKLERLNPNVKITTINQKLSLEHFNVDCSDNFATRFMVNKACIESGIIAPLVGIIGSIQALEVIKVILNLGEFGYLLLLDADKMQWRKLKLHKDPSCSVCGS
ncbi:HesA/MoeB/ThiF family protein [Candidatus Marithrix sp. Canyon 246]|uniref:HesA/MoeB/ThiF family protein n=1 Tax=Candidatus Marithrix sp. Canyon 246 TaxID=1827136 RepID=UPI000849F92D|nr:ThiF family adenylyltransferase [Candidatus Marithrix sp. Canyon 246]